MFVCSECGASGPSQGNCPVDGTQLSPIGEDLLLGQTIGAYRIARLLGIGGMGRVYKGVHPSIGSRVAIKVLSRECSDRRDLVDRFFSEARAVNLIRHESIVNVLDLAMLPDGRPYIIMEYLDGAPLANVVEMSVHRQMPLPLGGLARLCAEVLDALGAAHAKGVVHRDLKPDNIFVAPSGRPKVLDFGIAKLTDLKGSATATGSLLGTPHYMAPEQAAGRPIDHRADIYAMGVILFECATGQKPFIADSLFDLLRKHVEAPPPPPRALRPDMPPDFERVILCALAKAPEQRFASAQAMSMALQQATQGMPEAQWTTITGGPDFATTMPRAAWSPTPPQSWGEQRSHARPSAQPPMGQPMGHPSIQPTMQPSMQPSMQPQAPMYPPPGHHTTVSQSSGQLQTQPTQAKPDAKRGGSKGVVALLALVLAGGGIAAAVAFTRGDDSTTSTTAATPTEVAPTTVTPPTQVTGTPPPTTTTQVAGTPPTQVPPPKQEPVDNEGDDFEKEMAKVEAEIEKQTAGALKMTNDRLAEAKAKLEKAGIKTKIVKDPLVEAAEEALGDGGDDGASGNTPSAGGWFKRHSVSPPNRNWSKIDIDKHVEWAIAEAKRNVPDARLTRIDVSHSFADGNADLTLDDGAFKGSIDVRFISPSRSKRDPNLPRGVSSKNVCEFRVLAGPSGSEIYDFGKTDCKTAVVPRPRCSIEQVWKKAIKKRPDLAKAVADLTYTSNIVSKRIVWMFGIEEDGERLMSEQFPDDC
ncbi:MAG: serine/threonine protein kinase [Kofleriaceae bacterium]